MHEFDNWGKFESRENDPGHCVAGRRVGGVAHVGGGGGRRGRGRSGEVEDAAGSGNSRAPGGGLHGSGSAAGIAVCRLPRHTRSPSQFAVWSLLLSGVPTGGARAGGGRQGRLLLPVMSRWRPRGLQPEGQRGAPARGGAGNRRGCQRLRRLRWFSGGNRGGGREYATRGGRSTALPGMGCAASAGVAGYGCRGEPGGADALCSGASLILEPSIGDCRGRRRELSGRFPRVSDGAGRTCRSAGTPKMIHVYD